MAAAKSAPTSAPKSRWTRQSLPRVVFILGAESALREEAIAEIKTAAFGTPEGAGMNIITLHGPASPNEASTLTPADILDEACTASMFGGDDETKVVLVRQADVFLTDKEWREIFERNAEKIPASTTLVFEAATYGQLKNTRFYKSLAQQNAVAECDSLAGKYGDSKELEVEVDQRARKRGLNLSHGALLKLLGRSAKNLGVIEEELDKLGLTLQAQPGSPASVSEEHIEEYCSSSATYTAFNFADAVIDRNAKRAMEVLGGIFDRGIADSAKPGKIITNESSITMLLLGALTWKLSQLQDAQTGIDLGKPEREAFTAAKVPPVPFLQDAFRRTLKKHTTASLRRCMDALFRANLDLRVSGLPPQEVMEQMLWRMVKS
ncbi:MAG TPA: DNA polymerase III subunit delta [Planctomycetota bacterium]|nr:DNA polymerase III subunit delta [Planctomycetota bacterium]